jgi:hypothetical protein
MCVQKRDWPKTKGDLIPASSVSIPFIWPSPFLWLFTSRGSALLSFHTYKFTSRLHPPPDLAPPRHTPSLGSDNDWQQPPRGNGKGFEHIDTMAPGISYDESGSLANYFGVTFLILVLVPSTYVILRPDKKGESGASYVIFHAWLSHFTPCLLLSPTTQLPALSHGRQKTNPPAHLTPLTPTPQSLANYQRIAKRKSSQQNRRLLKRGLPLLAAWLFTAYLCYGIYQAPGLPGQTVYDPFQVLGISGSSTEKQIKKHYKKLSLQL